MEMISGVAETLEPGLRRILAPNPSPLTGPGTNTYLLGTGQIAVIDPGPDDPAHLSAILAALGPDQSVSHIFVTHSHLDHSPLARALSAATGAPILAFGDSASGRSAVMRYLAEGGTLGGGEGVDADFAPTRLLKDGETVAGDGWQLTALYTPGHFGNHMAFLWGDALFSGDLVMGWATSLVSPPDGDLTAFMASCRRLSQRNDRIYYPGHGHPVTAPKERVDWLIAHRLEREAQILTALQDGPSQIPELTRKIYTEIQPHLFPAAERNVLAHLIDLTTSNRCIADGPLGPSARYSLP